MTDKPNPPESEEANSKSDDIYDVFDDLRDTLVAEAAEEEQVSQGKSKKKGLLSALKNRFSKKDAEVEQESDGAEVDTSVPVESADDKPDIHPEDEEDVDEELLEEYLDEVEASLQEEDVPLSEEDLDEEDPVDEPDEEVAIDSDESMPEEEPDTAPKAPRLSEKLETKSDHIRDIALEGYEDEVLEEVDEREVALADFMGGRMGRVEWAIILIIGFIIGGVFIWGGIQTSDLRLSEPKPTPTPDPNVPTPASVELPGGWSFSLEKGNLNAEGLWEPVGAEWLEGTEICKWIALPWNTQLEAVVRTLEADDTIEITMSNYDVLVYSVQSREKIESSQAEDINLDIPSVLLILSDDETDDRWVVTAVLDENVE